MKSGLIGHTGFVGGNLTAQYKFDRCFNSKNINEIADMRFDLLVCSGVSAVKWLANKEPEKDLAAIKRLEQSLATVSANKFVLISTIDVYPVRENANEDFDCHKSNHAYGTHRLMFEDFCNKTFKDVSTIRLPGLFGNGLKKNVVFDLLNDNCLEVINPNSSFQYYDLDDLWKDIEKVIQSKTPLINLFSEPVKTSEIINRFFPGKSVGKDRTPEIHYNLTSKFGHLNQLSGSYYISKNQIIDKLGKFIENYGKH